MPSHSFALLSIAVTFIEANVSAKYDFVVGTKLVFRVVLVGCGGCDGGLWPMRDAKICSMRDGVPLAQIRS